MPHKTALLAGNRGGNAWGGPVLRRNKCNKARRELREDANKSEPAFLLSVSARKHH